MQNSQELILDNRFQLIVKIGKGSFGSIFRALDILRKEYVAVKIEYEKPNRSNETLKWEIEILTLIEQERGFPKLYGYGIES